MCNFEDTFKNVILVGVVRVEGKVWINPAGKNTALVDVSSVGLEEYEEFY